MSAATAGDDEGNSWFNAGNLHVLKPSSHLCVEAVVVATTIIVAVERPQRQACDIASADGRENVLADPILAIIVLAMIEKINVFVAIESLDQLGDMIPLARTSLVFWRPRSKRRE
ncbi:hypothetical protein NCU12076 [Neurospora crassa OR74A]|uniref:Uncharacterized protein n=1 Tax=Neurospora crassa (strain ATCC 24698 / 74-OR23-1A / CBS 708.71 / DSM 1257 / FGSC 987) TaxID=367110 RepID=V5ILA9_NEUCR|nr:hypothetical protein NCU12076 [Neurospora crassa OR74A]ESA42115.1 hypothetical protein NCU12076 [Neurospora crassa OR74A]|eukprot:XP_011395037.1 hypothetical protein NCU12076 [Neurospora crassa OR74A]